MKFIVNELNFSFATKSVWLLDELGFLDQDHPLQHFEAIFHLDSLELDHDQQVPLEWVLPARPLAYFRQSGSLEI